MSTTDLAKQNWLFSRALIEECVRSGVQYFVICPGSRSTFLALAVFDSKCKYQVHVDERGAAFHALGYAKLTRCPVAIITTSGTAVANLLPAVIEAHQDHVPLLILSADRPQELIETGANQSIRQEALFCPYVNWETNLTLSDPALPLNAVLTTAAQAVNETQLPTPGPVHLNLQIRETAVPAPLKSETESLWPYSFGTHVPHTQTYCASAVLAESEAQCIAKRLSGKRGVMILGSLDSHADATEAVRLASVLKWPVLPDILSQMRLMKAPGVIHYADLILEQEPTVFKKLDVVLHVGGPLVSKQLHALTASDTHDYILLQSYANRQNTLHRRMHRVVGPIEDLCHALCRVVKAYTQESWYQHVTHRSQQIQTALDVKMEAGAILEEWQIARAISQELPSESLLFVSNSLPIRMMDKVAAFRPERIRVISNRGASGIDGIVATATGAAVLSDKPVTLLIGDLAAFHDLNSFQLIRKSKTPIVTVVVNNGGGDIFTHLGVKSLPKNQFDTLFKTPQNLNFEYVAALFELPYAPVKTVQELKSFYKEALRMSKSVLIDATVTGGPESLQKLKSDLENLQT